jgi:hypothetical protein
VLKDLFMNTEGSIAALRESAQKLGLGERQVKAMLDKLLPK